MAKGLVTDTYLTDIANAIRSKNGASTQYKPSEMAAAITNLPSGGSSSKIKPTFISFNGSQETSLDLSNLDTSLIISMISMFDSCRGLTSLDLSNFNTSNVINMMYMFNKCSSLTSLDLSKFNTNKVTNMSYMFYSCDKLTSLDLSSFDTTNVTNMNSMFYSCHLLTSLDLKSFNIVNTNNIGGMFSTCSSLTRLDLSNFDTTNVTNMNNIFYNCSNLTALIINNPKLFELKSSNCFDNSAIANGTGYVYVPDDMVDTYKAATNWSVYADQIKPISELPEEV